MATISIEINDAAAVRVRDALCAYGDYANNGDGLTKTQFAKRVIAKWAKEITLRYEARLAESTAYTNAWDAASNEVTIS